MHTTLVSTVLFSLEPHPLHNTLCEKLPAIPGHHSYRHFPDGESYLRIETDVQGRHCMVLADLSYPDKKILPLLFLVDTLRELGAASVGLVAPYLSYMRQDKRFAAGEAVTSKTFACLLSQYVDWLVTVDPHLHRYHALSEIYSIPYRVIHGAPLLAQWLEDQSEILLVGPDAESQQWVSQVAEQSGHPYVVGEKLRRGDRDVVVSLPDLAAWKARTAVIVDDVISSGQTVMKCIDSLQKQGIEQILCAAIHGIFVEDAEQQLMKKGISQLITANSIPHPSNGLDLSELLLAPILECLETVDDLKRFNTDCQE
ncbi:ribose-phosphate diphosphokinase [Photobacterium sp. SDRW27]|uniref:ribose-phosphate diphosphokinase n=1 Tax=Photobacterium obscurum TaxID=2829490 RepID=UPI00224437BD|nr:ribose-phosphate diphosphokinase [Photobacterium obscurum]MCW8328610.1 ribose-phosphate diphosphokinase [Photobacterium obscurum]